MFVAVLVCLLAVVVLVSGSGRAASRSGVGVGVLGLSLVVSGVGVAPVWAGEELPPASVEASPQERAEPAEGREAEESQGEGLEAVVVPGLTTERSTTRRLPDGTFELDASQVPVNFRDAAGEWRAIDNTLVPSGRSGYAVENAAGEVSVKLPEDPSARPVLIEDDQAWVSLRLEGAGREQARVEGDTARYSQVADADEVTYAVNSQGVKETLVLDERPSRARLESLSYDYVLDASAGLTPRMSTDGGVEFADAKGRVGFSIPAGTMFDSASPDPVYSDRVSYELTETATSDGAESAEPEGQGGRWRLRVVPDAGWLGDPARVFPVFIDPTVALGPARDCILAKDLASTALCGSTINVLQAGRRNWTNKRRSVLDFDLSAIPATAAIQHANVELYLMKTQTTNPSLEASYDMFRTAVGFTGSATWNSSGYGPWSAGSPTGARLDRVTTKGQVAGWRYWNVADAVRAWHYDDIGQTGFVLKQAGAETVNTRLSFHSAYTAQPARAPNLNIIYGESANPTAAAGERDHFEFTTRELSDRMEAKVNIGTGNFLLSARDMSIKGVAGWDMAMTRTYNSATFDTGVGSMGLGWTTMFGGSIRLEFPDAVLGGWQGQGVVLGPEWLSGGV